MPTMYSLRHSRIGPELPAFPDSHTSIDNLPPELLALCFLCLPEELRARLNVSQVSRKWRELCISTPRLWTYLAFDYDARYYEIVKSTMARARNLPLHVNCLNPLHLDGECKYDTPPEAWELLQTNMPRIRHLEIEWGTVYYQPILPAAPILEIVRYERDAMDSGLFMVPKHWGGDGAPLLHTLEVSHFLLPRDCQPFHALRNFRGSMLHRNDAVGYVWGYQTDARDLFELFPALEVLRLRDVRTESLLPEGAFPPSLQAMYLDSARDKKRRVEDIVRYAAFLRGCTGFPLRQLYLADADRLEPIVAYYIREVGAVDRLAILSSCKTMFDSTVVLRSKEKPARLDVTISSRTLITTTTLRASLSLMVALRHFTCSAQLFKYLVSDSVCIPTLKILDVLFVRPDTHDELAHFTAGNRMVLPNLRNLTVWCVKRANVERAFRRMMQVLAHHVSFTRPKLALVTLMVSRSLEAVARGCDLDIALPLTLATQLRVKNQR